MALAVGEGREGSVVCVCGHAGRSVFMGDPVRVRESLGVTYGAFNYCSVE